MNSLYKNLSLWLIIGLVMVLLYNLFNVPRGTEDEIIFSDFMAKVERAEVDEIVIQGKENLITGKLKSGKKFKTYTAAYPDLVKDLRGQGVKIAATPPDRDPWYMTFFLTWGPILVIVALWIFFMRQMQMGGNKALSFGKSRAKLSSDRSNKVTFADVAGID
ncbi:MAG: ATP-dependent metallopeptidase FtsH/Yme1/Tma family protein, partial [Nitrospirae bacterium]|nr:ATP-dependent metallopeptidase FtsH/Yme1/Tma family protein [Nitrospirota bacterium]